jgi:hypothetical protein
MTKKTDIKIRISSFSIYTTLISMQTNFIILKLADIIDWSWFLSLIPLYIIILQSLFIFLKSNFDDFDNLIKEKEHFDNYYKKEEYNSGFENFIHEVYKCYQYHKNPIKNNFKNYDNF